MRMACMIVTLAVMAAVSLQVTGDGEQAVPAKTPPPRWSLPVKLHAQEVDNWCWAASGQMVMEYHGRHVAQGIQANHRFKRTDCVNHPCPGPCNQGGWPDWAFYHFSAQETNKALTMGEIAHQIYTLKKPITFLWAWTGGGIT